MSARPMVSFLDAARLNAPMVGARMITVCFDNQPDTAPGSHVGYSPCINLILPTKRQGRFGLRQRPGQ